ncbi:MAG: lipase family protein [Clostridia bacterium]|nr:lipase family protein [Clostridia bacterium]
MNLAELFSLTLHARYVRAENDASFAFHRENGTLYILFEASSGSTDWENNLDFPALPYRDMPHRWMCHRGFLRVWKSAEPYIAEAIAKTHETHVTVSGYSHGGALAMLCHEYIWFTHKPYREHLRGFGFGAPRVLWRLPGTLWPKERWQTFTVVRNLDDAVTHLPPAALGYTHVGTMLEIGEKGRYTSIDAHRPESYEKSLEEYISAAGDPWHV